ncbi:MAG TPA: hypothetical protein VHV51_18510 [Polyangiaceae bacterium]|nr:hypothetical protein [Polyangiaceae bacterium]
MNGAAAARGGGNAGDGCEFALGNKFAPGKRLVVEPGNGVILGRDARGAGTSGLDARSELG